MKTRCCKRLTDLPTKQSNKGMRNENMEFPGEGQRKAQGGIDPFSNQRGNGNGACYPYSTHSQHCARCADKDRTHRKTYDMNVEDARKLKHDLQTTFAKMIRDYEDATGLRVTNIELRYEQSMTEFFGRVKYVTVRSELY